MHNPYKCLMVQGTTSDAGKSTLVAGLCRVFKRRGLNIAPFKPQNMALNSAVTQDGGEIGRAQAVQAQAAGVAPSVHMNPVLLKPSSDCQAQVIIQGRALAQFQAQEFHNYKPLAQAAVFDSLQKLSANYSVIVVEGAGSPAEINLREGDIANMGFAEAADCPVIIIADIDRGGVFAHLVGTLQLLSPSEQARVKGFVINRFRGDYTLLAPGIRWLENYTQKPVLGTLPYLKDFHLEAEDAIQTSNRSTVPTALNILVPVLPRISNHTDFDPLRLHPEVKFRFVALSDPDRRCDLIILPGSKNVRADLAELNQHGWADTLNTHLRYGGKIIGICGGMQMLGAAINDPLGIEDNPGSSAGFNLLNYTTELKAEKNLHQVCGFSQHPLLGDCPVEGYEIHAGTSYGPALENPLWRIQRENSTALNDGTFSSDGLILATYIHGLFDNAECLKAILRWAGVAQPTTLDYYALREAEIDRLADCCEEYLNIDYLLSLLENAEAP